MLIMDNEMIGFDDPSSYDTLKPETGSEAKHTVGGSKKSGGFQSMGLSFPVIKGIQKRGYKIPTPIQRKTIPLIMDGCDVVAMARTGSGKTACFLIPLLEKLKSRVGTAGARALILSPTRELAVQTLKFFKELGRFTDLRASAILGGDSMDNQFSAIHGNPDIIVATPGRFLHICIEMELKLSNVEYIVFDEADRLFEMGFGEQLREIVNRLPESRQTVLFSATLPKVLVEFAKAGLTNPVLLRLDVESKLPDQLKLAFISCRPDEKEAALLCLMRSIIKFKSPTVLFAATSHHVEYLHRLLDIAGIPNTYIYSNLDPSARKINVAKFQNFKVSVLVVTDIAARGIDIPQLDNVINFNFPATAKLFVHRVGRCARAGRQGTAYSLICPEEHPYLLDLHLFLNRPLNLDSKSDNDGVIGRVPQELIEESHAEMIRLHDTMNDLASMKKVCNNAYKKYIRSRPGASVDSMRRVKEINLENLSVHPEFVSLDSSFAPQVEKSELLERMKTFRPQGTIFEIGNSSKSESYKVMKTTRLTHRASVVSFKRKREMLAEATAAAAETASEPAERLHLAASDADDIKGAFSSVIGPKRKRPKPAVDTEHYIPYTALDQHTEKGFAVNNFQSEAAKTQFDLTADSEDAQKLQKKLMRWDRKKKKMVGVEDPRAGKIRTESGAWIPATYKSNRYDQWKEKVKVDEEDKEGDDDAEDGDSKPAGGGRLKQPDTHWGRHNQKVQQKEKSELKRPEDILKARKLAVKMKLKNKKKTKKSGKRRMGGKPGGHRK